MIMVGRRTNKDNNFKLNFFELEGNIGITKKHRRQDLGCVSEAHDIGHWDSIVDIIFSDL